MIGSILRAHRVDYNNRIDCIVFQKVFNDDNKVLLAKPLEFVEHDIRQQYTEPTFTVDGRDWQSLFNELWNAGMRPTDWEQKSIERDAQTKHISDLRTITFKLLKIDK